MADEAASRSPQPRLAGRRSPATELTAGISRGSAVVEQSIAVCAPVIRSFVSTEVVMEWDSLQKTLSGSGPRAEDTRWVLPPAPGRPLGGLHTAVISSIAV